jgi:hypothetical protein
MPGRRDQASFAALEGELRGGRGALPRLMREIARSPAFKTAR